MNSLDKPLRQLDAQPATPAAHPGTIGQVAGGGGALAGRPLVWPDRPVGPDELGRAADAAFLAEVLMHRRLETPFCLGLFGAAGSGKTFFLNEIADAAGRLSGTGGSEAGGPFVADAMVVRVDAARSGEAEALLAGAVLDRLADTHPALAADLAHAGADPIETARAANETLNDLRRRHQAERDALDELGSREARLVEAVLEAPGSALDSYARAHRSSIEGALRQFGFDSADGIGTYKALVREAAEARSAAARLGLSARALWAYRGQSRLLVFALLLALLAWGLSAIVGDQASWIASLRAMGEKAGPSADWAQAHIHWLGPVHSAAVLLCIVLLALNVLRARRFLRPILKGAMLLQRDLAARTRDLQGLLAHQTRRVDGLAAEVESAGQRAAEAEARAGARPVAGTRPKRPQRLGGSHAAALFAALGAAIAKADHHSAAPGRVLIAIDNLDARSSEGAAALLEAARRLLGPGFVCIASAGRSHLVGGFGETDPAQALARFERCVQVGYRLDAGSAGEGAWRSFAEALIGGASPSRPPAAAPDHRRSDLDRPWRPREAETLTALCDFAGDTPRAVKRYVNVYRIARADPRLRDAPAPAFTALALALALDRHGLAEDLAALARSGARDGAGDSPLLRRALAVAAQVSGQPVDLAQARQSLDVASRYTAQA